MNFQRAIGAFSSFVLAVMPVKVQLERCKHYTAKSRELIDMIRKKYPDAIIEDKDGPLGAFEVTINGNLVYSKAKEGKHPNFDDIVKKVGEEAKKE